MRLLRELILAGSTFAITFHRQRRNQDQKGGDWDYSECHESSRCESGYMCNYDYDWYLGDCVDCEDYKTEEDCRNGWWGDANYGAEEECIKVCLAQAFCDDNGPCHKNAVCSLNDDYQAICTCKKDHGWVDGGSNGVGPEGCRRKTVPNGITMEEIITIVDDMVINFNTSVVEMWGKAKPNWQDRLKDAFTELIEDAKNEVQECKVVENLSEEDDEEQDDDDIRGLANICKEDAKTIRRFFRKLRSWSATFTSPCSKNEGDNKAVIRIAKKSNFLQNLAVRRRCKFLK